MSKKWDKEARLALYREAFAAWGETAQVDMLVEELGECIVAVQKLYKRDYTWERAYDLASEMADVKIMIEEICMNLDEAKKKPRGYHKDFGKFSDLVKEEVDRKLDRTQNRLAEKKKITNVPKSIL